MMSEGEWQNRGTTLGPADKFQAAETAALLTLLALAHGDAAAGRLLPIERLVERVRASK